MKFSCYFAYLFTLTLLLGTGFTQISVAESAIEATLKKAAVARSTNLQQAKHFAEEALLRAKQEKNTLQQAAAHKELGLIAFLQDDLLKALSHYEKSIALFAEEGQQEEAGSLMLRSASIYSALEKPEEAFRRYFTLLSFAETRKLEDMHAKATLGLANLYAQGGLYEKATETYVAYLDEVDLEDIENMQDIEEAYTSLADSYQKNEQIEEAIATYKEALDCKATASLEFHFLMHLAYANFEQKNYGEAAFQCEQLAAHMLVSGAFGSAATALLHSKVLLAQEKYEEALQKSSEVQNPLFRINFWETEGHILSAEALIHLEKYAEAEALLQMAADSINSQKKLIQPEKALYRAQLKLAEHYQNNEEARELQQKLQALEKEEAQEKKERAEALALKQEAYQKALQAAQNAKPEAYIALKNSNKPDFGVGKNFIFSFVAFALGILSLLAVRRFFSE